MTDQATPIPSDGHAPRGLGAGLGPGAGTVGIQNLIARPIIDRDPGDEMAVPPGADKPK